MYVFVGDDIVVWVELIKLNDALRQPVSTRFSYLMPKSSCSCKVIKYLIFYSDEPLSKSWVEQSSSQMWINELVSRLTVRQLHIATDCAYVI